ncbi:hypothetical protein VSVS12_03590 [Vibrio scophthalmi]|uniref:GNAT family N-acetyltransferase n=1 Tax=Vibrio scophthalmi TaxID=45658 RepID=UPI0008092380|nr:GNAT family acetyltransferase [Vibrio scophthalmi]ANS87299.1 hypothetical protein VSVS12_03590 [Vibrio scophthalmi]
MIFRSATANDVASLIQLQHDCYVDNLNQQQIHDGFLDAILTKSQLISAIKHQRAIYVAELDRQVVAMAVCAPWPYWHFSPMMRTVAHNIGQIEMQGCALTRSNSLLWGPVCVQHGYRGQGIFASLFEYARTQSSAQYRYIYTVIHQANRRSRSAHINKVLFVNKGSLSIDQQPFTQLVRTAR